MILPEATSVQRNRSKSGVVCDDVTQSHGKSEPSHSTRAVAEAWFSSQNSNDAADRGYGGRSHRAASLLALPARRACTLTPPLMQSEIHSGSVWFIESNQKCSEILSPMVMHTFNIISLQIRTTVRRCSEATPSHEKQTVSTHHLPSLTPGSPDHFFPFVCSLPVSISADTKLCKQNLKQPVQGKAWLWKWGL